METPFIKCDKCEKPAIVNYQTLCVSYPVDGEEYGDQKVLDTVESEHFCEEHDNA